MHDIGEGRCAAVVRAKFGAVKRVATSSHAERRTLRVAEGLLIDDIGMLSAV